MLETADRLTAAQMAILSIQRKVGSIPFSEQVAQTVGRDIDSFEKRFKDFWRSRRGLDEIRQKDEPLEARLGDIEPDYRLAIACSGYLQDKLGLSIADKAVSCLPKVKPSLRDKQRFSGWGEYFFGFTNAATVITAAYAVRHSSQAGRGRIINEAIDSLTQVGQQPMTPLERVKFIAQRRGSYGRYIQLLEADPTGWKLLEWYTENYKQMEETMSACGSLPEHVTRFFQKGVSFAEDAYQTVWRLKCGFGA